jgi:hypothetical protein
MTALIFISWPHVQTVFVRLLRIHGHTWVVPFTMDENESICLITAFPSRKVHKRYGGKDEYST